LSPAKAWAPTVANLAGPSDTLCVDVDANALLASILIGTVGLGVFIYGKRQSRFPQMIAGIVLMAYPYFVSNVLLMAGIAMALLAALWLVVRLGW
jgi:hypothetical protein